MTTQPAPDTGAMACPRCGVIDRPVLSPGTGPHAYRVSCSSCRRFIKWVSLIAPSERMAHKLAATRKAMAQRQPSAAQLAYLEALGYVGPVPGTMQEASARIERLLQERQGA